MKLFVTGCAGFIGSRFCEMAIEQKHDVIGIDSLAYSGRSENLSTLLYAEGFERRGGFVFLQADICDAEVMNFFIAAYQPDAIIHFAAETHVARSIESREEFLRTNVLGTNVLLEESLKYWRGDRKPEDASHGITYNFRFLHVSTDEVYGSLGPNDEPWTEDSPYLPNNPYSASKAASDHLVRSYNKTYGLPTIITHSANNYGKRQHPEKLIPTLIRQCMNGQPMTLHGDGQQKRDWLHVDDHCRGLLAALDRGVPGEVYNFGGECERTNTQVANLISGKIPFTYRPSPRNIADRAGNDRRYLMDIDKAFHELGWEPKCKIEDGIAAVVKWYLENPNYGDEYGR